MDSFYINMQSATQAQKTRAVLARSGIRSTVERYHSRGKGCSFRLRVYADRGKVCPLLAKAGIPCDIS